MTRKKKKKNKKFFNADVSEAETTNRGFAAQS